MRKYFSVMITILSILLVSYSSLAGPCTEALTEAMRQEGLTNSEIKSICRRAAKAETKRTPKVTADQVEKDLVGKIVGGWIFQKTEWRDIDIMESEYDGDKAKIIVNIDTIRNKSGSLKLRYKRTGGGWKLYRIFNIDFN